MKAMHLSLVGASLLAACASGADPAEDGDEQHAIAFHGELEAFPGFSYDTGALPANSPVQLQLQFAASGKLIADAAGTAGGSGATLAVAAVPGSGVYKLDAHLKAAATLHVHITGVPEYDGPIPGIENLDIALAAQTTFDPFLLGGNKARLSTNLPETELPPIPLGSIPGKLIITVSGTSTINSTFWGICAGLDQGKLQFLTEAATSATIVLEPKIVISVPFVGDKEFEIPEVHFDTGSIKGPIDMGTIDVPEGGEAPISPYNASNLSCSGVTCKAPTVIAFTPFLKTSIPRNNQCSSSQIYSYIAACVTSSSTDDTCRVFMDDPNNVRCGTCIATDAKDSMWGAMVDGEPNIGGCIALLDPSQQGMAAQFQASTLCEQAACDDRCTDASEAQYQQCVSDADTRTCGNYNEQLPFLVPTGAAAQCVSSTMSPEDQARFYANLFCGAL